MALFDMTPASAAADLGFATSTLDREAWRREDKEWLKQAAQSDDARFIAICKDTPVLGFAGGVLHPVFTAGAAKDLGEAGEPLFLGNDNSRPLFALGIAGGHFDELKLRDDVKLIDMRSIAMQGLFTPGMLNAIGTAKAMLTWHGRHGFCSNCGVATAIASAGWKRRCEVCNSEHFPRTDPVVIMLAVRGDECLMGRAPQFPEGRYSCLAGFMEPGETIEDAVRREILEETGVRTGKVRYLQAQPWPFPSSLMIGCMAEALSSEITIDAAELADARWFNRAEVSAILKSEHPKGITAPPRMAIANHIMQMFVDS